jgi:hypothetical protein
MGVLIEISWQIINVPNLFLILLWKAKEGLRSEIFTFVVVMGLQKDDFLV